MAAGAGCWGCACACACGRAAVLPCGCRCRAAAACGAAPLAAPSRTLHARSIALTLHALHHTSPLPLYTPTHMQVPIMLRSDYCSLSGKSERDLCDLGECPYDQVGGGTACPCACMSAGLLHACVLDVQAGVAGHLQHAPVPSAGSLHVSSRRRRREATL